jgi:L-ascorbate metabolism protein UlaG (beta-lactamase superfamily)
MDITYLGHSSFRIKTKTAKIVTDPFDPKKVGLKYPTIDADIVTVSHDHFDHNFVEKVKGAKEVSGPGEYEISGVSIIGVKTYHDDKKGADRGKNTVYIFEADGIRAAHLGDLGHKLKEKTIEEMGEINILMIPVGGFYTIGPNVAAETVRSIEPQITIPMHYQFPGLNSASFSKLAKVDEFLKEIGLTVEKMEKLTINVGDLADEQKIVQLSLK